MGQILSGLPASSDERLLVGFSTADDAAVFRLNGETGLVQTVDFFTPIVDDPFDFGAISAANSLSDVYAMGGQPLTALSLVCFPYRTWPLEMLAQIVKGGAAKILESGAQVVGGHSVEDGEIKFGYAITGLVDPNNFWRNDTPVEGDGLVLSKPIGSGLVATAVKRGVLASDRLQDAVAEMKRLNAEAARLARAFSVHAATDVTGFGLMGHLYEMLRGQGLGARLQFEAIPLLDGAVEAIQAKALPAAIENNRAYCGEYAIEPCTELQELEPLLYDPQTSGGLLIALPMPEAQALAEQLRTAGHRAACIGQVCKGAIRFR